MTLGLPFAFEICLATIGVAFLSATASVVALFYSERGGMLDYEQWMYRAKNTIENKIQSGRKFEVKYLFPGHEREALSKGDRINF